MLVASMTKTVAEEGVQQTALQAGWCAEAGSWLYKQWGPTKQELVETKATLLTLADLETSVREQSNVRVPGAMTMAQASSVTACERRHGDDGRASRGLLHGPGLCASFGEAPVSQSHEALRQYGAEAAAQSSQERQCRQGLAEHLDRLLRRQSCTQSCAMLAAHAA